MVNKEKKKLVISIVLFVIILLLGIFLFSSLIDYVSVLEKQKLYARVIVSDKIGIDINGSALIFGSVVPGGSASRGLDIRNDHNQEVQIEIYIKGDISDFMKVSENDFILVRGESRKVEFSVAVPRGVEYGVYEGEVIVVVKNIMVK